MRALLGRAAFFVLGGTVGACGLVEGLGAFSEGSCSGGGCDAGGGDGALQQADDAQSQPDTASADGAMSTADTGAFDTDTSVENEDTGTGKDGGEVDATVDVAEEGDGAERMDGAADASGRDDSAADASDGSVIDASADAGPTFANPLQIDVRSVFNANTVVTTAPANGAAPLVFMDGTCAQCSNDFLTLSELNMLTDAGGMSLPDNGFFPGQGTSIPNVQLWWNNASNVENSLVVSDTAGTVFSFDVPPGKYSQLQIYATGGSGGNTLNVTFDYSDTTTASSKVAIPDWCLPGTLGVGQYTLVSSDRAENGTTFNGLVCSIFALDLDPDPTRSLVSVNFYDSNTEGNGSNLVFYGATAW